jgi:hypothetical protein
VTADASARLRATARRLLEPGPLTGEELARSLYGATGPVAPWLRLVDSLLAGQEDFQRLANGRWGLRAAAPQPPLVITARRTGARGGRLLELAVSPADAPRPLWRWKLDPRPAPPVLPPQLDAPEGGEEPVPFAAVAAEVAEVLHGRDLLLLDDSLFALLCREFELCGMPPPVGVPRVLGHALWLHDGGKRSLAEARAALGLVPSVADDLLGELELLRHLHLHGVGATAGSPEPERPQPDLRGKLRQAAASLPRTPGVYLFKDAAGGPLYVGSASNLRRRALSYFSEQIELTRGLRGLLSRAASLEHVPLATHLDAVLHEAELIESLQPPYNVQRKVSAKSAWLRVGAEPPVNVVQVASAPRADHALYIGPLPNRAAVDAAASVLTALWGFGRRGGSARTSEDSLGRLRELRTLLADPERFCGEMRLRLHAASGRLSSRGHAALAEQVERTERAALGGELAPVEPDRRNALIAAFHEESGHIYLTLVRELRCLACARVPVHTDIDVELVRVLSSLLGIPPEPGEQRPEDAALTARWLHAHRFDRSVLPLDLPAHDLAARLAEAVRREALSD